MPHFAASPLLCRLFFFNVSQRQRFEVSVDETVDLTVHDGVGGFRKDEIVRFHRGIWTPDWNITSNVLAIGLSPFLMNLAHCLVVVIVNNQLKNYGGDMAIAAYGVINRFTFVFAMIVMGLNQGMQPIVGYNYGARQYKRVVRAFHLTAICATVITSGKM